MKSGRPRGGLQDIGLNLPTGFGCSYRRRGASSDRAALRLCLRGQLFEPRLHMRICRINLQNALKRVNFLLGIIQGVT